jgi:hypothetical protein
VTTSKLESEDAKKLAAVEKPTFDEEKLRNPALGYEIWHWDTRFGTGIRDSGRPIKRCRD